MTHLPSKLAKDKDDLRDIYEGEKNAGNNPKWRYIKSTGIYCVKVGRKLIKPPKDNFTCKLLPASGSCSANSN